MIGDGHQKDQAMIRSLQFSVPMRGEGLDTEFMVDQAYVTDPRWHPSSTGFGELLGS